MQDLINKFTNDKYKNIYNILKRAKDDDWDIKVESYDEEVIETSKIVDLTDNVYSCDNYDYNFAEIANFNCNIKSKLLIITMSGQLW